jgi:hypothetical protein
LKPPRRTTRTRPTRSQPINQCCTRLDAIASNYCAVHVIYARGLPWNALPPIETTSSQRYYKWCSAGVYKLRRSRDTWAAYVRFTWPMYLLDGGLMLSFFFWSKHFGPTRHERTQRHSHACSWCLMRWAPWSMEKNEIRREGPIERRTGRWSSEPGGYEVWLKLTSGSAGQLQLPVWSHLFSFPWAAELHLFVDSSIKKKDTTAEVFFYYYIKIHLNWSFPIPSPSMLTATSPKTDKSGTEKKKKTLICGCRGKQSFLVVQ